MRSSAQGRIKEMLWFLGLIFEVEWREVMRFATYCYEGEFESLLARLVR